MPKPRSRLQKYPRKATAPGTLKSSSGLTLTQNPLHTARWQLRSIHSGGHNSQQPSFRLHRVLDSTAMRRSFQTTGTAVIKVGGGRPRTTTAGDDRYINLQVKRGRHKSASVIAQQLCTTTGRQVSWFTVARRLHKGGLFTHRPERCLPLKVDHR
ncbi:transposable element Tcb2 transposase [Trichonephila clavipes]|nr:transposable element Tcb2 transposase [Trichonephila clavipes]